MPWEFNGIRFTVGELTSQTGDMFLVEAELSAGAVSVIRMGSPRSSSVWY